MYKRFKQYLDERFRNMPNSEEVTSFREELLHKLLDTESECRAKGVMDDDKVYETSILSLETLDFMKKLDALKESSLSRHIQAKGNKILRTVIYNVGYLMILVLVYLMVGFIADAWHPGWLIIVIGAMVGAGFNLGWAAKKALVAKRYIAARVCIFPIVAIFQLVIYLVLSCISNRNVWGQSWLLLLLIPLDALIIDMAVNLLYTGKINKLEILGAIFLLSVDVYLVLAVLHVIAWHPYWTIILGGLIIDILLGIAFLSGKKKKK